MKIIITISILILAGAGFVFYRSWNEAEKRGEVEWQVESGVVSTPVKQEEEVSWRDAQTLLLGDTEISVEIVASDEDRMRGLSGRTSLSESEGLLFIFPSSARHGIWMKDMNFSIDIIWLDESGRVVDVKKGATPESYPETFRPRAEALYVLEVNAGVVENAGVQIGDTVQPGR